MHVPLVVLGLIFYNNRLNNVSAIKGAAWKNCTEVIFVIYSFVASLRHQKTSSATDSIVIESQLWFSLPKNEILTPHVNGDYTFMNSQYVVCIYVCFPLRCDKCFRKPIREYSQRCVYLPGQCMDNTCDSIPYMVSWYLVSDAIHTLLAIINSAR